MFLVLIGCRDKLRPQIFEPENISTNAVEYSITFSNTGSEVYFAKSNDKWGSSDMESSIYYSVKEDGKWLAPEIDFFFR